MDRMDGLTDEEWSWCPTSDDRIGLPWRLSHIAEFLIFTRIKRTGPEDRRQLRNLRHALQTHVAQDDAGIASAAASSSSTRC